MSVIQFYCVDLCPVKLSKKSLILSESYLFVVVNQTKASLVTPCAIVCILLYRTIYKY